ncbi:cytochrome b ascorbate-dependent protein 3 [Chanos chanos]|uniref:Lysosomal membrane ascorbate-dependent ferrireductase CYB561A3 n=1 Tax=Chanos chanos TaxID=29144 RepID=A0A6J2UUU7_CHACN|nr:cytochrome b ascorbate-dependent protein 3-like [Chanos chanos]
MSSAPLFYLSYVLCVTLGFVCVVFVCYWNASWRGGFAWDGSGLQFNWHPVLMVTGLVVLYGNAVVLYRIPLTWGQTKQPWKLLHALELLMAMFFSILGLCAVFDFHHANNIPDLYSLHSWLGISTTVLFTVQWVLGLGAFLFPCSPVPFRALFKPVHVWMGHAIFILSLISCISGINEKLILTLNGRNGSSEEAYSALPAEALFANSLGILIIAFGLVVLKILSNQKWQRPQCNQEESVTPLLPERC